MPKKKAEEVEGEVLEAMPALPEAPAVLSLKFETEMGFDGLLAIRDFDPQYGGRNLLRKLREIEKELHQKGCKPPANYNSKASAKPTPKPKAEAKAEEEEPGEAKDWCPIHETKMKKWEKEGRSWYSHKIERPDGTEYWCNGKEK